MCCLNCIFIIILIYLETIGDVDCDCTLKLDKDFGTPPPVFIRNGEYLSPDSSGTISLRRSETVTVGCPGNRNFVVLGNDTVANVAKYDVMEASCIINSTFRLGRWIGQFKDVRCSIQPWFISEETREQCYLGNHMYRFGYKLKNILYPLYEACFDKHLYTTYYVKHHLTPLSQLMQHGQRRPAFIEGSMFEKIRMSSVYTAANQKRQLDYILGPGMSEGYVTKNQYLTRGHLAARADYVMNAEHRATFHYANTAPQWRRGNAGDWAALEEALRRRVQSYAKPVVIYTGTHGVFTLADRNGQQQQIYLAQDANDNNIVPVPMYFYKIVYDPQNKSAVAFISINSSFYNKTMIDELAFCKDICEGNKRYSWLKWRSSDGTYSFCCNYSNFSNVVKSLPSLDVRQDFY